MNCQQCGRPAIYAFGDENLPLCLSCSEQHVRIGQMLIADAQRQQDRSEAAMYERIGVPVPPHLMPRETVRVVMEENVTLNHINIENSNVGVVNTGVVESIDSAVGLMATVGGDDAAAAFTRLTEAIMSDAALDSDRRDEALELVSVLAEDAAAPPERRKRAAMRAVLRSLGAIVNSSASLVTLWGEIGSVIEGLF